MHYAGPTRLIHSRKVGMMHEYSPGIHASYQYSIALQHCVALKELISVCGEVGGVPGLVT